MKLSKPVALVLFTGICLLLAWSIITAVRVDRLETRLKEAEAANRRLETRHRAFAADIATALVHSGAPAETVANAKVEVARESLCLPEGRVELTAPSINNLNSLPAKGK